MSSSPDSPADQQNGDIWQFGLRQLLVLVTATAILLSVTRASDMIGIPLFPVLWLVSVSVLTDFRFARRDLVVAIAAVACLLAAYVLIGAHLVSSRGGSPVGTELLPLAWIVCFLFSLFAIIHSGLEAHRLGYRRAGLIILSPLYLVAIIAALAATFAVVTMIVR